MRKISSLSENDADFLDKPLFRSKLMGPTSIWFDKMAIRADLRYASIMSLYMRIGAVLDY